MQNNKLALVMFAALAGYGGVGHAAGFGGVPVTVKTTPASTSSSLQTLPGLGRTIMSPVTVTESDKIIKSKILPVGLNQSSVKSSPRHVIRNSAIRVSGDTAASGPASITELARALKNDPDLIYEYVYNNIEYYPIWGTQKGALGTILDNQGTSFDQAALMVALLRASGYTATYMHGQIGLTGQQLHDWWGLDTSDVCNVLTTLGQTQIPYGTVYAAQSTSCPSTTPVAMTGLYLDHVWVKAVINGTSYVFDPSYKPHTFKAGLNLASITGYLQTNYLSSAETGATVTADYVQGINRTNVRNNLTTYANSLLTYLRANPQYASLDDVVGGKNIVPLGSAPVRQTVLPYQAASSTPTEWTDIPASYSPTLQVQYQGINQTYTSDFMAGKRLTITYNSSNMPVLSLDGVVQATGTTAVAAGANSTITLTVTHGAYADTSTNQTITQQIVGGGTYLIGNSWGTSGRGAMESHQTRLDQARDAGGASTSEPVMGETLAVLGANWVTQLGHSMYITDQMAQTMTLFHHQVGIVGYNKAPYVDLPGNRIGMIKLNSATTKLMGAFRSDAQHLSILESTAVQQTTNDSAVSTVKLIDMAVQNNYRIYNATNTNYAGTVQPNLVSCSAWGTTFQSYLSQNTTSRLILPDHCTLTEGTWSGSGFYSLSPTSDGGYAIGSIISGGLSGGFASSNMTSDVLSANTNSNQPSQLALLNSSGNSTGDPIDMVKGNFLLSKDDLSVGVGDFPSSLGFTRSYTSSLRTHKGSLGRGWTHNFDSSVRVNSDGLQGMGEDSALDAASALVEKMVALDLLADSTNPLDKIVVATLGQRWFGDQITNNTVIVQQGMNSEVFVKLADGSYNPPPASAARLILNADTTYTYELSNRDKLNFNTAGKAASYQAASGLQASFTYTGNDLTKITNNLGRSLTLSVTGGNIMSVSDGSRTVSYVYDTNGNLTSATDPLSQATTYAYDQPGRMTAFNPPSQPNHAAIINTYDSLGRVMKQVDANGWASNYYFAGSRVEEVNPLNGRAITYLDAAGRVLKSIDQLGNVTTNVYDGRSRLASTTFPEGNQVQYAYDDASCASVDKRCTNNVKTITQVAKPGSGLANLTQSRTYESAFNQVATATDANGKVTSYTYTAQGLPLTVTSPADTSGVQPVTTFGYTAFMPTQSGFTTPFYLLTSKTDKVSSTQSVLTAYTYQPAASFFVPSTVTVDSGTGKLNLVTTFTYDAVGNRTKVVSPLTGTTQQTLVAYDAKRRPTTVTDALGKTTVTTYDADDHVLSTAVSTGASSWMVTCQTYTPTGKVLKSWGPGLTAGSSVCPTAADPVAVTDYLYDSLDRSYQVIQNLTAAQGGNRVSQFGYDADSRVAYKMKAVGTSLAQTYVYYAYTPNGQVTTLTDARNNKTTYAYDGFDRLVKVSFPSPGTAGTSSATDYEQYTYDNNGNQITIRKRSGDTVTLAYDNLNRLLSRTYPSGSNTDNVTYAYDLLGRRLTATATGSASQTTTDAWDNAGRLTSETQGTRTVTYAYDTASRRTKITWPNGAYVTTNYDLLNRPTGLLESGTTNLVTYGYATGSLSQRLSASLGNGLGTTYTYNNQALLSGISHTITSNAVAWTYSRNQAQDITGLTLSNTAFQWTGYANGTTTAAVNGLNQFTTVGGGTYSYDTNGSLKSDGVWTYGYDLNNRLISASKTGATGALTYDADGRLRKTVLNGVTTELLYDGVNPIAEYDGAGNLLRRYVMGPGTDEPAVQYEGAGTTTKYWFHADQEGSVVARTNSAGTALETVGYGPFGETATAGGRFRYTGQQYLPELGLYYYKARIYSPVLGRFLQTDPIGTQDDLNLYGYVKNNPFNAIDSTGLSLSSLTFVAVQGVGQSGASAPLTVAMNPIDEEESRIGAEFINVGPGGGGGGVGSFYPPSVKGAGSDFVGGVGSARMGTAGGPRAGKPFTPKGQAQIDAENAERNGGVNVCENCGNEVVPGQKSERGVVPPKNERQRDHIIPKSKGGDGDPSNGQILCRQCNRNKSDK